MAVPNMKNPSLLILLLLPLAAPQWGWGGFRSPLSRSPYSPFDSSYSGYGSPMPEPEPEPAPRLNRRLVTSRQENSPSIVKTPTSSTSFDFSSSRNSQASRVPKRTPQSSFDFQSSFNQVSRTTQRTTRVPRRTTRRTTRASTTTTRPTTRPTPRPTTRPTTRRTTTRAPVIIRRPTTPTPAPSADSRDIFEEFDKDNFIDDVFEAEVQGGERPSGWVLPPSLMAVAAVPGAPVINPAPEARVPKDVREEGERVMDPYLQFMPVPAVPDAATDSQAPRRPKESLSSFDLDLNLPNTVEVRSTLRPSTTKPTRRPTTRVAPSRGDDEKRETRKKFKRCQGRCVQEFCLPVESIPVYEKCVNKCKTFCT